MLTRYTPEVGFTPLSSTINEDSRISFPKACNTSGTATNYVYSEINKVYDRIRGSAVDELKFFSGIVFPISVIALVFRTGFGSSQNSPSASSETIDYSIIGLYLIIILALIMRAWIILRINNPNFDDMIKAYVMSHDGSDVTDLKVKEDYQWADDLIIHLEGARKAEKRERFWRKVILGIIAIFVTVMIVIFKYPRLFY